MKQAVSQSTISTVIGSSLFWVWGFLCYLSPVLFPHEVSYESSIGIEYGFFASQITAVLFALFLLVFLRKKERVIKRGIFLGAALLMSLSAGVVAGSLQQSWGIVTIFCGVVDGVCVPLLGIAWGTRYSVGARTKGVLIVFSFLLSYLWYFLISCLPYPLGVGCVILIPLISWWLWRRDARARHAITSEAFPLRSKGHALFPDELTAGSQEVQTLPWRMIVTLAVASAIGNFIASMIMGQGYGGAESLFSGGVFVGALIATMSLVILTNGRNILSERSIYRITLTFTALGLVILMVFDRAGMGVGGALLQGSSLFFQVLIIVLVTQGTQELGISPLLSFGVGQGLIAGVVLFANVLGKQWHYVFGFEGLALDIVCGSCILLLFFMTVGDISKPLVASGDFLADEACGTKGASFLREEELRGADVKDLLVKASATEASGLVSDVYGEDTRIGKITKTFCLTKREEEILGYLAKGRSLPYVADILFVTTGTVKTHTTNIYRKLGINSRQELIDLVESFD